MNDTPTVWVIIGPYMSGYIPGNDPQFLTATARDAVAALIDEVDFQCEHWECPLDDDETAECVPCSDMAHARAARQDLVRDLEAVGDACLGIESYANGFGGFVRIERAESCAMETRRAWMTGAAVAECPMCGAVCAYWDAEDLTDDGELMCSHENPRD